MKNIESSLKSIGVYLKLEGKKSSFVIPAYQRAYSWNENNCEELWEAIENFNENQDGTYFFGTIIVCNEKDNEFELIDGQQRTTTFILLLKALLIKINEIILKIEDKDNNILCENLIGKAKKIIELLYKQNEDESTVFRKNIKDELEKLKNENDSLIIKNNSINELYKDELKKILYCFDKNEIDNLEPIKHKKRDNIHNRTNFFKNFMFFYTKLRDLTETELNIFANKLLKCKIIEIKTWSTEQAITLFNSLNGTGMPLSDADIISSSLYLKAKEQKIDNFSKKWENLEETVDELKSKDNFLNIVLKDILTHYMYIQRALANETNVKLSALRTYYLKDNKESLKEPIKLVDNLLKIADIWNGIKEFDILKVALKFNSNIKFFIISYLFRFKDEFNNIDNKILKQNVVKITEILLKLFVLLEVTEQVYSSNEYKVFLFKLNVKLVDKTVDLLDIKKEIINHIKEMKNIDEVHIKEYIEDKTEKNLVILNEYLYSKETNQNFSLDSYDIEHIMPKSNKNRHEHMQYAGITTEKEFKEYVEKLGNKIVLEAKINRKISDARFKSKVQEYANSDFNFTKNMIEFKDKDSWTKDDIDTRTKEIANRIYNFIFE